MAVTNETACTGYDTSYLKVFPAPQLNLEEEVEVCEGDTYAYDAGPGYESYLWNTGSTEQSITVNTEGLYWVEVTNEYAC